VHSASPNHGLPEALGDRTFCNFTSADARHIERFTMTGANTIRYEVGIEDPRVSTRPFTIGLTLARTDPGEYGLLQGACREDNQDLAHLKAGMKRPGRTNG
jgi:hypothetical protein